MFFLLFHSRIEGEPDDRANKLITDLMFGKRTSVQGETEILGFRIAGWICFSFYWFHLVSIGNSDLESLQLRVSHPERERDPARA